VKLPFQLDRYTLSELIGAGAFGRVYRAEVRGDLGFVSDFAVKLLDSNVVADNPNVVRQMADEARLLAQLDHPNIVKVIDFKHQDHDILGDLYFMVLEYVRGVDVAEILERIDNEGITAPATAVLRMGIMVADALAHAHDMSGRDGRPLGLVHRDLKPQNLMVNFRGQVKVLDFGIAKAKDHRLAARTQEGQTKGTVFYMSPEQLTGDELDARSDLYSLATILYEMLLGRRLLEVEVSTPADLARAMHEAFEMDVEARLKVLRAHLDSGANGDLPEEAIEGWIALLRQALQKDPRYRPDSARVFSEQLEWLRSKHPPPAVRNYWATVVEDPSGPHSLAALQRPPVQLPDEPESVTHGPLTQEFFGMESGSTFDEDDEPEIAAAPVPMTRAMSVVTGTVRAFGSSEVQRVEGSGQRIVPGSLANASTSPPPSRPLDKIATMEMAAHAPGVGLDSSFISPEDLVEGDATVRKGAAAARSGGPDKRVVLGVFGGLAALVLLGIWLLLGRGVTPAVEQPAPEPSAVLAPVIKVPPAEPTAPVVDPAPGVEPTAEVTPEVEATPEEAAAPVAAAPPTPRPRSTATPRPRSTPKPAAPKATPAPAAAVAVADEFGTIHLSARPRSQVEIDGKDYGTTDETRRGVRLPVGTYTVRFICADEKECGEFVKRTGRKTVTIRAGERDTFTADFYRLNKTRR